MHVDDLLFLIPLLPLLGFLANGLFGRRMSTPQVGVVALLGPVTAFVLSVLALLQAWQGQGGGDHGGAAHHATWAHQTVWTWIETGRFSVDFGLQVDPLTAIMLMNVTGIGSLIHLYSYGYMKDDPGFPRFMAYLNLFLCAMLLLVMGDNLLLLFVGWEGVGLCSYLLIGFWYSNLDYTDAGRKAFIVNRVGDFAFLIGAFTLFAVFGTLSFEGMEHGIADLDPATVLESGPFAGWTVRQTLVLAALCLFGGATGKSAQIPLYIWLPDAMAGPTPVSALIHAATMVTAGVYLVGRMDFMYVLLPEVGQVVAVVAAFTALVAGLIAVGQNDIKKVLAYSTVSQLGFMFAGMGTTAWTTGLHHVVTHAFFKALLFLGAGAIIHAMHHEQDMRKMGGLFKDLRYVAVLFLIGCVSLAGIPYVGAGFFSKDAILAGVAAQMTHEGGLWALVFGILVFTAALTAFYTVRMAMMTFFWPPADSHLHLHHLHWSMPAVLTVLAALSLFAGAPVGWFIDSFTHGIFSVGAIGHEELHHAHNLALLSSLGAVVVGVGAGFALYRQPGNALAATLEGLVAGKFYVDEAYEALVVRPLGALAQGLFSVVDRLMIDQLLVEGPGRVVMMMGGLARQTQNGAVSVATATTLFGAVAVLLWMVSHG